MSTGRPSRLVADTHVSVEVVIDDRKHACKAPDEMLHRRGERLHVPFESVDSAISVELFDRHHGDPYGSLLLFNAAGEHASRSRSSGK